MKFDKSILTLYAVTAPERKTSLTLYEQVEQALKGGATLIQFRDKLSDNEHFTASALELKPLCQRYGVPLIINDNVDTAVKINADGVHVGQSDMPPSEVRAIIGDDKLLGVSVQTIEQAVSAQESGADYLGVGAVFATATKSDADSVTLDVLKEICNAVNIPVVAIGGIDEGNLHFLSNSGICGVAVVSAIFSNTDIVSATQSLKKYAEDIFQKEN